MVLIFSTLGLPASCVLKIAVPILGLLSFYESSAYQFIHMHTFTYTYIHTEETRRERDTCTPMFIAALFTIARTWKQYRCPSADEWIRKLWYIYIMEYYPAIKKNAFE